jgi:hypothetical protein
VEPAETFARAGAGAVLAADPPVEAQLVDHVEQVADVELTPVGLTPVGNARNLQMTDPAGGQVAAQGRGEVALDDLAVHRRALLSAAEELGSRLRALDKVCRTLTLTVRYADRTATTRSRTLGEPTAHSAALTRAAYGIYEALGLQRARVRCVALRAEGLDPAEQASHQLTFDPTDEKLRRIEEAADRARARFGPLAVVPGTLAA